MLRRHGESMRTKGNSPLFSVVSYGKDIHIVKRARELLDELGKDTAK